MSTLYIDSILNGAGNDTNQTDSTCVMAVNLLNMAGQKITEAVTMIKVAGHSTKDAGFYQTDHSARLITYTAGFYTQEADTRPMLTAFRSPIYGIHDERNRRQFD